MSEARTITTATSAPANTRHRARIGSLHHSFTGAGAPPPARTDADASPRIPSPRLGMAAGAHRLPGLAGLPVVAVPSGTSIRIMAACLHVVDSCPPRPALQ